ncbi:HAD-IB family phosphatase [Sulfurimonas sp. SAG-AH-194-L11]|nr:HAD family hydrolase [Sulfurimonas sp. SAG-AH-194-L11]MDF1877260.1 HAD-IB family phosphatase [Sulfurimonas sp. SAG-AH-194-L11]
MQKIIFTDLDGTLTLKDTYTKFVLQNLRVGVVLKNLFPLLSMVVKHRLKIYNDDDVKMTTFKMFFTGYDRENSLDGFAQSIPWNTKVLQLIETKRQEGYKVILVTASPDIYVKYICEYLGYDGFISTKTVDTGRYLDGNFDGKVCNFLQKPKRILEFLDGVETEHTISYGNSSGDTAMLEFCDESYFVKKKNIKRFEK